jgi:hypothetical protein
MEGMKLSIHTAKRAKNREKADFLATMANMAALAWGQRVRIRISTVAIIAVEQFANYVL